MRRLNARVMKLEQAAGARAPTPEALVTEQKKAAVRRLMSYLPAYHAALDLDGVAYRALGEDMEPSQVLPWARTDPGGRAALARVLWHERVLIQREKRRPVARGIVRPAELCGEGGRP